MKKILVLLICSVALYACNKCGVVHYEITKNIVPARTGYPNTRDSISAELCGEEYKHARVYLQGDSGRKVVKSFDNTGPNPPYTITTVTRIKSYGKE